MVSTIKKPKKQPRRGLIGTLMHESVIQYLSTGVVVFYADYLVFYAGYTKLGIHLALAQAAAYIVGVVTNFFMERYWVFKRQTKREKVEKETKRYIVVLIINYLITYVILRVLQHYGISPLWGKYAAAFFFTFWNYVIFRFWVFKGPTRKKRKK